jgi:23S rRNA (guanine745-N1)-methyltransferase
MKTTSPYLLCPVCTKPLQKADSTKGLACVNRHLFDQAKQGYHNLLLSQNKKSKQPGDTTEMVASRREFLDKGYYEALCSEFISIANALAIKDKSKSFHYCDLACGEGYYTQRLHAFLSNEYQHCYTTGIDISTPAIKSACRRDKSIQWLVSSAAKIPLADNSQDLVTGLFFHFDLAELTRILRPGGHIILVNTGPKHLIQLRQIIYEELKPESQTEFNPLPALLEQVRTTSFGQEIHLSSTQDILNLLSMTPHYWRCKPEKKQLLEMRDELSLQLDIQFDVFRKQ